eukprot:6490608-Amphidinium_carterae.2
MGVRISGWHEQRSVHATVLGCGALDLASRSIEALRRACPRSLRPLLIEVWSYSELGQALFSSSISGIASEQMRKKIDEKVSQMSANKGKITEASLLKLMGELRKELTCISGIQTLVGKREVTEQSRGLSIVLSVKSVESEATTRVRVALRATTASLGHLLCLPGEAAMVEGSAKPFEMERSLHARVDAARGHLHKLTALEEAENLDGDKVLACPWERSSKTSTHHPNPIR